MERLDKVLSNKGFGSRNEVKKLIKAKKILVNDVLISSFDYKVNENDLINVDGFEFTYNKYVYIMLNKPKGYVVSNYEPNSNTIFELIYDGTSGLFSYGRLDKDTTGLCIISNDGELGHKLLSNKHHVFKKYIVKSKSELSEDNMNLIRIGITIDNDEKCKPAYIKKIDSNTYELDISEGKYHQIKRMFIALNNEVIDLKRIGFHTLKLDDDLELGEYRYLSEKEIEELRSSI